LDKNSLIKNTNFVIMKAQNMKENMNF